MWRHLPFLTPVILCGGCDEKRSGSEGTPALACPESTTAYEWTDVGETEQRFWCEDESGLEQGPYRVYLTADGRVFLRTEGAFTDGEPDGTFTSWYDDGTLWKQQGYRAGLAHGRWGEHWDDGSLYVEREFRFGIGCGLWRLRPLPSGDLELTLEQRPCAPLDALAPGATPPPMPDEPQWDGERCPDGLRKVSDEAQGARRSYCTTTAGALEGPYAVWFTTGARMIDGAFADGKRSGTWRVFFGNGRLRERGDYAPTGESGEHDGLWTTYRPAGGRSEEGAYDHGLREGVWTTFWPGDAIASTGTYVRGEREGRFESRDPLGTSLAQETYAAGVLDGPAKTFYPDGAVEQEGSHQDGQRAGRWVSYWPDGRPKIEALYRAGRLHGTWRAYHRAGPPSAEVEYVAGLPEGLYRQWFLTETGTAVFEATFVHGHFEGAATYTDGDGRRLQLYAYREGLRDGAFTQWYPSGALHITGTYLADERHGLWTEYFEEGGVRQVCRYADHEPVIATCHAYLPDGTEVPWTQGF